MKSELYTPRSCWLLGCFGILFGNLSKVARGERENQDLRPIVRIIFIFSLNLSPHQSWRVATPSRQPPCRHRHCHCPIQSAAIVCIGIHTTYNIHHISISSNTTLHLTQPTYNHNRSTIPHKTYSRMEVQAWPRKRK